jgi:hypothetical protein
MAKGGKASRQSHVESIHHAEISYRVAKLVSLGTIKRCYSFKTWERMLKRLPLVKEAGKREIT